MRIRNFIVNSRRQAHSNPAARPRSFKMMHYQFPMKRFRLIAASLALLILVLALAAFHFSVVALESFSVHEIATYGTARLESRSRSVGLQQAAFRAPDLMPVYGSSELGIPDPAGAGTLFRSYPTGFDVFLVGHAGATPLLMLQNLAAVSDALRGKKVAISFSPVWVLHHSVDPDSYAANFSRLGAYEVAFNSHLSPDLKQSIASRMLQYPKTLNSDPLLKFTLQNLSQNSVWSPALYFVSLPLAQLQILVLRLADDWATLPTLVSALMNDKPPSHIPATPHWDAMARRAEGYYAATANNNPFGIQDLVWQTRFAKRVAQDHNSLDDQIFMHDVRTTAEWQDLILLLSVLKEQGAKPLLLTMPFNGKYMDYEGVSLAARQAYYATFRSAAQSLNVPVVEFANHDEDPYFLRDPGSHLSPEGWIYYDQALDNFYHNRLH